MKRIIKLFEYFIIIFYFGILAILYTNTLYEIVKANSIGIKADYFEYDTDGEISGSWAGGGEDSLAVTVMHNDTSTLPNEKGINYNSLKNVWCTTEGYKFAPGSAYFTGVQSRIRFDSNAAWDWSSDFCWEGWLYLKDATGRIISMGTHSYAWTVDGQCSWGIVTNGTQFNFAYYNGSVQNINSSTFTDIRNVWTHVCVERKEGLLIFYVNGNIVHTIPMTYNLTSTCYCIRGALSDSDADAESPQFYWDEERMSTTWRHGTTFIPSNKPYTVDNGGYVVTVETSSVYVYEGLSSGKFVYTTANAGEIKTKVLSIYDNLEAVDNLSGKIWPVSRDGANIAIGFIDTTLNSTVIIPNLVSGDWNDIRVALKDVPDTARAAIREYFLRIDNADAGDTFYIDEFGIQQKTRNMVGGL